MRSASIILLGFIIFDSCSTKYSKEIQITEFSSEKNWQYFDLDKPVYVKIISHLPTTNLCGNIAVASVTIAETKENDTIRILDLCSSIDCQRNDVMKITPAIKPDFHVILPYRTIKNPKTKKNEAVEMDMKILKTTYGNLSK